MLADTCRMVQIPIVAVLGNHDHHASFSEEICEALGGSVRNATVQVTGQDFVLFEV